MNTEQSAAPMTTTTTAAGDGGSSATAAPTDVSTTSPAAASVVGSSTTPTAQVTASANVPTAASIPAETLASTNGSVAYKPAKFLESMVPIFLIIVMFYFLVMRPQQKREAKNRELRSSVKKGDKIITTGGIIGTIHKIISDKEISLEIAENIRMRILRASLAEVLVKGNDLGNPIPNEVDDETSSISRTKTKKAATSTIVNENSAKKIAPHK
jgi:preprotein translocase subunit YajC